MLISCKECGLQISDKAKACPHCGYPMDRKKYNPRKLRLPNGFGRITKLNNPALRNPYRAMITAGKDENGKPIGKLLKPTAYFKTYNDAYEALLKYHKDPYTLEKEISVKELYDKWSEKYFETCAAQSVRTITSAWAYCHEIYGINVRDIRTRHVKACIYESYVDRNGEKIEPSANTRSRIKSLLNLLFDYAVEYEIMSQNYARNFKLDQSLASEIESAKHGHMSYSEEEIDKMWKNITFPYVDVLLIQCYSGWRPQELLQLTLDKVDIVNWAFSGGMKTAAGVNRTVPIHTAIRPLVENLYKRAVDSGCKYLVSRIHNDGNGGMSYDVWKTRFTSIKEGIGLGSAHRPHDGRKHFVTIAKSSGVDEYAIKRIVGHAINDLTEAVYTDRNLDWLRSEIEKIKGPSN